MRIVNGGKFPLADTRASLRWRVGGFMKNEGDGEHLAAGQDCPAAQQNPHTGPTDGCDSVRVFQVPPDKRGDIEKILDGSKHFTSWKKAGRKVAGLFIIAACVTGELSIEPNIGQVIHAHGGHENKRVAVRRNVLRKKSDGADPKPWASRAGDNEYGCQKRVDLCEHRTETGICLMQDRLCRWIDRDCVPVAAPQANINNNAKLLASIDRKISAVQESLRTVIATPAEACAEPAVPPATDDEARRLFALLRTLELESYYRKAPVTRVFQLYCLEGLTRDRVAKKCRCSPALVTLRLRAIEAKLGRKASALCQISDYFDKIADSLSDSRARHIRRESALHDLEDDEETV